MIDTTTRIYAWLLQMTSARMVWSNEKIVADHDTYLESMEYHYNQVNRW